jgi:hypothetical protein
VPLCPRSPPPIPARSGAADTDAEAEERADALTRAGVILRLSGVAYLRPQEIAEMVYRVRGAKP